MSARGRTDALVRDIAALFVKYRLRDWAPIIERLEGRAGRLADIAKAIEELSEKAAKPRKSRTRRLPPQRVEVAPKFSSSRTHILEPLWQALMERRVLASATDLRAAYLAVGVKAQFPSRRQAAIDLFVRHLDKLSDAQFHDAVAFVARNEGSRSSLGEDYLRWSEIILKSGNS